MEDIEAFAEVMEAFMDASVEASMEDMEDMKASTDVPSTGASTKAFMEVTSTKSSMEAFMEVLEAVVGVMEAFMEVTSTEVFMEASVTIWKI